MRIRKLELHGFKSFPDRTTLHFDAGISAIVGPNGCGKSNVVDALRWCIGEQSARSLRGSEMQDVIFAGSAERKPVGFAEVTMTLIAEDGEPFPGEYAQLAEVSVGRRLHRTGASEYLINQRRVRRRDVVDLFLDTGVGNNLYSFIEQGRIGKIVHARPEERRSLIDEAAGISRYKARREEARDRLAATSTQLDRAADVAEEMTSRLRSLHRQVLKAARFRRFRALVRQDEIALAVAKYSALAQDRRALRGKLREARSELQAAERGKTRREADLEQRRSELRVVEEGVEHWRDEVAELDARRRELEGAKGFATRRLTELDGQEARDRTALERAEADEAEGTTAAETAQAELSEARVRAEETSAAVTSGQEQSEAAQVRLRETREAARAARQAENHAVLELERLTSEAAELDRRAEALPERSRVLSAALETATVDAREAREAHEAAVQRLGEAREGQKRANTARGAAAEVVKGAERAEAEARGAVSDAERAARTVRAERETRRLELERLVQRAERELAGLRSKADSRVDAAAEKARREAEREVAAAREGVARASSRARSRAETWAKARAARAQAEGDRLTRSLSRALQEAESRGKGHVREVEVQGRAEVDAAIQQARGAALLRIQEAREGLGRAAEASRQARDAKDIAARNAREAAASMDAARTRLARTEARARALEKAAVGSEIVHRVVPDAVALHARLDGEARGLDWLGRALGPRAALPVVHEVDQVLAVAKALGGGRAELVLRRPGDLDVAAALGAIEVVDDLAAGVRAHLDRGVAAVVRATGERIDADGTVHLGPVDDAGQALLDAVRQRDEAAAEVARAEASLERAQTDLESAEAALAGTEEARLAASAVVAEAEEASAEAERTARTEARERVEARVAEARAQAESEVAEAREVRRQRLEAHHQEVQAVRAADVVARDSALERVEAEGQGSVEAAVARVDDHVRQAREAARVEVRQALARAEEAVDAARTTLAEHQEQASAAAVADEVPVAEARKRATEAREALDAARAALDEARNHAATADLFRTRAEATAENASSATRRTAKELEDAKGRLEHLAGEQQILATRRALVTERRTAAQAAVSQAREAARSAVEAESTAEASASALQEGLAELRVQAVTWRERARAAEAAEEAARTRVNDARTRAAQAREGLAAAAEARAEARKTLTEAEVELEDSAGTRAEAWDRLERERERVQLLRKGVEEADIDLRRLLERVNELTRSVDHLAAEVESTRSQIEALLARIDERYQLSLPGVLDQLDAQSRYVLAPDPEVAEPVDIQGTVIEGVPTVVLTHGSLVDEDEIAERVERLAENRRALERIGQVNLAAFEEYAEVASRHTELETQRADLEASVARIRAAIAKMNRTCRQRFRDTFDLVNQHFQEMYPRLVGGGSARLSLTDEEDLLETGVDIFVQPPGKRLQNLSLLSGGEKAMTAIALILSLFKVKPSPFCVLDEVDAPLDEANGSRFNAAIEDMSSVSQFIVITHNRKTMECARTLYGVTMSTPGVSSLVSVRVNP